jgi:hypothetical protein
MITSDGKIRFVADRNVDYSNWLSCGFILRFIVGNLGCCCITLAVLFFLRLFFNFGGIIFDFLF